MVVYIRLIQPTDITAFFKVAHNLLKFHKVCKCLQEDKQSDGFAPQGDDLAHKDSIKYWIHPIYGHQRHDGLIGLKVSEGSFITAK